MGGVFGGGSRPAESKPQQEAVAAVVKKAEAEKTTQVTQGQEESAAKLRGARRRGRQLLSDARLNPEMGMKETLGSTQNL
jgi:vacuolar-type H+-ATPase subunit H